MIEVRRSADRGLANHGWLNSAHTFSFANYHDPAHRGFGVLRVINEDRVAPGQGFGSHGHRDMEIVSYVLEGALEHKDSLGTGAVLRPGDVQCMSAGTGVVHSEFNASRTEGVHFLQIWILPRAAGGAPSYAQQHCDLDDPAGRLRLLVSEDGRDGSLQIRQAVDLYAARLDGEATIDYALSPGRAAYLQVARGALEVNGRAVVAGDGVKVTGERALALGRATSAEVLLFDLPAVQ